MFNRMKRKSQPNLDSAASQLAETFKLLGDQTRLRILLACMGKSQSVSAIAETLNLSAPLVSHHLRLLRAVRMVNADRQGKQVFYTLMDDHVRCVLNDMLHHLSEPHED